MKNIGPVSLGWLQEIGVLTIEDLRRIGSVPIYIELRKLHTKISLNLLWALEGAILDIDCRELSQERKKELRAMVQVNS